MWAPDGEGHKHLVTIPNVRCIPAFTDTLISVDELWRLSHIAAIFQDTQQIELREGDGSTKHSWPFTKRRGLYVWDLKVASKANSKLDWARGKQHPTRPP